MIKSIIFDFGNVFIEWDPRLLYREMFASEEALESFMRTGWRDEWNSNLDAGATLAENMEAMLRKYPQQREYVIAYHTRWEKSLGAVNAETVALLADLKRAGYAAYGLSNWSSETFSIVRRKHPFFELLDGMVISGEEKLCKPDPKIFQLLMDRYGLLPASCAFVDDRDDNVQAAQQLGIAGIQFFSAEQARQALRELGVNV
jgi:2-haloacid dehalogenase